MRSQPRSGKRRHVLRWVAVAAVVVVAAGTLGAYLKYRAVYDSITRVAVPSTALGWVSASARSSGRVKE